MVHKNSSKSEMELLARFGDFSKNMTQNHQLENLSEFILHDVCATDLFSLPKAAYLVNNPDFTCLKGVAGYHHPESFSTGNSWQNQKAFTSHMKSAEFNQKVRSIYDRSLVLGQGSDQNKIHDLAHHLNITDPLYHVWNMKHDNQGILIFERPLNEQMHQDHLLKFLYMLSFCPVF